jgi:hypothetical protein
VQTALKLRADKVFREPDSPDRGNPEGSRGMHLRCAHARAMPEIVPEPKPCPRLRVFPWSGIRKAARSRQDARRLLPAARAAILPTLCSVD